MTEKEAAKHLLTYSTTMGSGQTTDAQHNEAKRIAIKALEQKPCEDATLKDIFCMGCEYREQDQKTGHWIPIYQGDEVINYRCSECEFGDTFGKKPYGMKYCTNCGAKMEG